MGNDEINIPQEDKKDELKPTLCKDKELDLIEISTLIEDKIEINSENILKIKSVNVKSLRELLIKLDVDEKNGKKKHKNLKKLVNILQHFKDITNLSKQNDIIYLLEKDFELVLLKEYIFSFSKTKEDHNIILIVKRLEDHIKKSLEKYYFYCLDKEPENIYDEKIIEDEILPKDMKRILHFFK